MRFEQIKTKIVDTKNVVLAGAVGAVSAVASTPCFAALDTTGLVPDTASFESIALIVLTAGIGFWAIRKAIALIGR